MSRIERAIETISPKWAYKRQAWRRGVETLYDAAARDSLSYNWNPSLSFTEQKARMERELVRSRAQDMERNEDITQSILKAFRRGVVGNGISMQPKTGDEEIDRNILDRWKEFTEKGNFDTTGTLGITDALDMLLDRKIVDGGVFIIHTYTSDPKQPYRVQIRGVHELDTSAGLYRDGNFADGVELDQYNRPIAYYFKRFKNGFPIEGSSQRIPADRVIFWYTRTMPDQVREISELSQSLNRIKDTNQFLEAVGIKERVLACLAVFIKKALPSGPSGRLSLKQTGSSYAGMGLEPGMIGELNAGDEVQTVIPSGQSSDTAAHTKTMVRLIASGVGLSYEAVSRDLSEVSYSSARQGLVEDRKTYARYMRQLIETVLEPIYKEFIKSQTLLREGALLGDLATLTKCQWIPSGSAWIDPTKEVEANKTALETNQTTLERICAENGMDWREVLAQRAREKKMEFELGVQNGHSEQKAEKQGESA